LKRLYAGFGLVLIAGLIIAGVAGGSVPAPVFLVSYMIALYFRRGRIVLIAGLGILEALLGTGSVLAYWSAGTVLLLVFQSVEHDLNIDSPFLPLFVLPPFVVVRQFWLAIFASLYQDPAPVSQDWRAVGIAVVIAAFIVGRLAQRFKVLNSSEWELKTW